MRKSSQRRDQTAPDLPVSKAARRAIDERLKRVWRYAKRAANKSEEDIEHVHQLRVATRRARAALRLFDDVFPRRQARWFNRTLRDLRLAANSARNLDVLGERLTLLAETTQSRELGRIVERLHGRRRKAQKSLVRSYHKAKREGFLNRARALRKRTRWRHKQAEPGFSESARKRLAAPVEEFFTSAAADLSAPVNLHAMRIAGKRLRYAMELLTFAFDDSFRRELQPALANVQQQLGVINDHATAIAVFTDWMTRAERKGQRKLTSELMELINNEGHQLSLTSEAFRIAWTDSRAAELKARFDMFVVKSHA